MAHQELKRLSVSEAFSMKGGDGPNGYAKNSSFQLGQRSLCMGGLMVLIDIILGRPNGTPHSHCTANMTFRRLESCLMDLVSKGILSEEKVESFNIPMYTMSPQELEAAVERYRCFSIKKMEKLQLVLQPLDTAAKIHIFASHMRAAAEGLVEQHFGEVILDELFQLYLKKLEEQPIFESGKAINFLSVLKRNVK